MKDEAINLKEKGTVYERVWSEEREGENAVIAW